MNIETPWCVILPLKAYLVDECPYWEACDAIDSCCAKENICWSDLDESLLEDRVHFELEQ